ncbi:MAG: ComEC/Rec2 family competence protein, partial [Oscillospiraceae bacterium]|nr:ComEC/Rec2 family competence protein [Oscillospiraceae bacterium]
MKRKMVVIGISYILGLFFASFLSHDKLYIIPMAALPVYIAIMLLKRTQRRVLIVSALSLIIGAGIYADYTKDNYFPVSLLEGTETSFMGKVEVLDEYDGEYAGYILDGSFRCGTKAKILCFTDNLDCRYGDIITVSGTFTKPESTYVFNSTAYYKGLSVFLEADYGCSYTLHRTDGYRLIRAISDYRERIQSRIYAVSGRTGGSLTAAMIFGDKSGLDERVENAFYHSGLGPMLALSGFHLILFNSLCNIIGRRTRFQRMLQFAMTVLLTALFSIVAMWPVSVLRAGLMLLLARGSCIFFRRSDSLSALCIAAIVLTLIQ